MFNIASHYRNANQNNNEIHLIPARTRMLFLFFAKPCLTICNPMNCSMLGFPIFHYLPEFAETHVHWVNDPAISSSAAPFSSCSQSFPASGSLSMSQLFTSGGQSTGASFSFSPSNAYSRLISFAIDWFDLAVQEILKSLLQHHISKATILQCSAFFMVQISHLYMTTGKTIALTMQTFVWKVLSLFFNMPSWFVIVLLSKRKCLLISWLQSLSTVILEPI